MSLSSLFGSLGIKKRKMRRNTKRKMRRNTKRKMRRNKTSRKQKGG